MKKVSSKEDLNFYFDEINKFVDEYLEKNISPSDLNRYVKRNLSKFKDKFKLSDIENIDQIIKDVIDHRMAMERDKVRKDEVFKFDEFIYKVNESVLSFNRATVDHEKVLADYFNTSLGHIDVLNQELHLFQVKSFEDIEYVIIFSESEVEEFGKDIKDEILNKIYSESIRVESLFGASLFFDLSFNISDVVSRDSLQIPSLDDKLVLRILSKVLPKSFEDTAFSGQINFYRSQPESFKGYYIWEIKREK